MENSKKTFYKYKKRFVSQRTKTKQDFIKWINSTFLTIMWLIIFLFVYYLWTLNANATLGYSIRDLDIQISQLQDQKEIIETKIDKIKSLDNISKDRYSNTDMEDSTNPISLIVKDNETYAYNY